MLSANKRSEFCQDQQYHYTNVHGKIPYLLCSNVSREASIPPMLANIKFIAMQELKIYRNTTFIVCYVRVYRTMFNKRVYYVITSHLTRMTEHRPSVVILHVYISVISQEESDSQWTSWFFLQDKTWLLLKTDIFHCWWE